MVRVLAMARRLFELPPDLGAHALPETLALARRAGLYLEVVGLADTATYTFDRRAFIAALGASCDSAENAFLELANDPVRDTQARHAGDAAYLRDLRTLVPSSVPVALGDTFHFATGLQPGPPVGDELAARQRSWDLVSADFVDGYRNTCFVDSPVERFDDGLAVRMYSAVIGNTGYTLGLGVTSTNVGCRWSDGWSTRTLLCEAGDMRFWPVSR